MPTLRELQAAIGTAMLGGDAGIAAREIEPDGLAPEARLEIYRHHVLTTLASALEATFPVICRLVDRRFFAYAADAYVRAHPPAGPCLFEYGDTFPDFLAAFPPCRDLAYLPDVARLEWALHECAQAADAPPLDTAALARVASGREGELRLALHPAVRFVSSAHPVLAIWEANQPGRDGTPDRQPAAERVLVHRGAEGARAACVDAASADLVQALARGTTLDAACDALGAEAARLPQLLARLAGMGILRDGAAPVAA